jgi:hypothetical protein
MIPSAIDSRYLVFGCATTQPTTDLCTRSSLFNTDAAHLRPLSDYVLLLSPTKQNPVNDPTIDFPCNPFPFPLPLPV